MPENNDNKRTEDVCYMCRRSESKAGPMVRMPGGFTLCHDCMQKTMDTAIRMTGGDFSNLPLNIPGMGGMDLSGLSGLFGMPGMGNAPAPAPQNSVDAAGADNENGSPDNGEAKDPAAENGGRVPAGETGGKAPSEEDMTGETGGEELPVPGENSELPKGGPENGMPGGKGPFGNGMPQMPYGFSMIMSPGDLSNFFGRMPGQKQAKKAEKSEAPKITMDEVPVPSKIYEMLSEHVVGQEKAKKAISVAIYNHYKRLAHETESDGVEIEKSNMLMIGPTGSGKTFLVKTLANLLNVPLAIADATALTEAGYIGDDIESVVTKLLAAAGNDVQKAETGIIYIDEIDKLARKRNATQRDVSGESVQQGLLKLLEGAEIEVPVGANSKNAMVPLETVNTKNILFICGGAFPDLEDIIKERLNEKSSMGFGSALKDRYDQERDLLKYVETEDIRKFGMIPEFIGRLPVVFTLEPMTKEMLGRVLKEPKNAIIKQYQKLMEMDEVDLRFADDAYEAIAELALKKDTGARALRSIIENFMMDIMFEIPKDPNIGRVTITKDYVLGQGGPIIEMRE